MTAVMLRRSFEMKKSSHWRWGLLLVLWALVAACSGPASTTDQGKTSSGNGSTSNYKLTMVPLVSNVEGVAAHRDGKMSDAWGLEFGHKGRIWVNNASGY